MVKQTKDGYLWYCPKCEAFVDSFIHPQGHMNFAIKIKAEAIREVVFLDEE